ncbi:phage regulatory CII family protein [Dongia soli]|uniref:Phage regulatory CII family protein n=1 Tax=Dongia soli TaxID=600628 RepID=A0ABU5E7K6_9PROT|nr:phage regulatory CII family protein [Dongia soli]MDY0882286.1 phage regulatory CII family protein [Dongia soli]
MTSLVESCGGQERVGQILVKSQSQVQRYTDPLHPRAELSLTQVITLEAVSGQPLVTAYLALQAHHALIPLLAEADLPLAVDMARFGERAAALFSRYATAMADHRLTPQEAGQLKQGVSEVMHALASMLADLDLVIQEGVQHG